MAAQLNRENWMRDLPTNVKSKALLDLAIPGTHDSGSYELDSDGPFAPGTSGILKFLGQCCPCVKSKVADWSLTQDVDILHQLNSGIRYVDIRTAYRADNDSFEIVHGLYGVKLSVVLSQIKQFSTGHDGEVVLLDFNQFYDFTAALHRRFAKEINTAFGSSIGNASKCTGAKTSLDHLINSGLQLVVIYHNDEVATEFDFWSAKDINSPWPNTASQSKLIESLEARFSTLKPNELNVFQAVLSPQASTIILHLCGSLKTTLAKEGNGAVSKWLEKVKQEQRTEVNIVIFDFPDERCIQNVLALNQM